ncbi:MAG: hypothetical protein ABF920_04330 [Lacticaseibacillus paracasei]|uniref:hypothetical protein n=1 Tax=Lacticaseibacillus paracasei TaxID=1597 RepID=UPI00345E03F4
MNKTLASFLVFLDTIGVSIALLGGNTWLCLLMGITTVILYVKVNPILFGDYDRKRKEKIEQKREELLARRTNKEGISK